MYKSRIMSYMETTTPETALKNNSEWSIKTIRREAKDEIASMRSVAETFDALGMHEDAKRQREQAMFATRWLVKFGVCD